MAERPGASVGAAAPVGTEGRILADGGEGDAASREAWRLETLREYGLMDSGREAAFDRVTRLVADLFEAPVSLITLLDDRRLWFKSAHGLTLPEPDRDVSFCQHMVRDDAPLIVADTHADTRFRDNVLVTGEPFIRFYAGVPLRAYNGAVLGTLCVIDHAVRAPFDAHQLERLESFAAIIMAEADLRRIAVERDEARRMLERALDFSGIATWQYDARADHLSWRGAVADLWGADYESALRDRAGVFERVHPDDRDRVQTAIEEAIAGGTPYAVEHRIVHPERGVRWLGARGDWDVRAEGAMLTGVCMDITEQKSRQENATLLMRELHHRMRNLFATVGAIISLTRHAARDVDDYVERISSRLDALNRAQNVLLGANFMTGSMHALLREVEASFPRIRWSGPDLLLPENALVAMALLFNELATNAAKHGALTGADGHVDVSWSQDSEGSDPRLFHLTWAESGGALAVAEPERTSFGTLLMERSVKNNLGGTIERRWKPEGLEVEIALPAKWREA